MNQQKKQETGLLISMQHIKLDLYSMFYALTLWVKIDNFQMNKGHMPLDVQKHLKTDGNSVRRIILKGMCYTSLVVLLMIRNIKNSS